MRQAQEISNTNNLFDSRFSKIPFYGKWKMDESLNSIKLAESFFRNPNYQTVYKNFDYSNPYHVWIGEGNYEYKQLGYMRMLSFPYKDYQFDIGDYITCIYDGKETTWIIKTITKDQPYECIAHIEKTNNYLKWVDEFGNLIQYRCVVSDKMLEAAPGRSNIVPPEGNIMLDVRRDLTTSTITENQKFIFGGIAPNVIQGQIYEVYAFKNFMNDDQTNEAILSLELSRRNGEETGVEGEKDDLYNNIPDVYKMKLYSVVIDSKDITQKIGFKKRLDAIVFKGEEKSDYGVIWESSNPNVVNVDEFGNIEILDYGEVTITARFEKNQDIYSSIIINSVSNLPNIQYYKFLPLEIDTILQGDEQSFSIYHYVNDAPDDETFSIKFSGVPNDGKYQGYFYDVIPTNGDIENCNEFSIWNNRAFDNGRLKIQAISNKTGEVVETLYIRLGGLV